MHSLLDATPDAIVGLDRQAPVVLINPAATSIFGVEPQQVVAQPVERLLPQPRLAEIGRITGEGMLIRSSRMARLESTALRRDGTGFPVEVAISRVEDERDTRFAGVVRDVTDQRWIGSMLRLNNRALECATNGVIVSDLRTPGQPIRYANPAFEKITGYSVGEPIGRPFDFLLGEDREQPEVEVLRQAVREGQPATVVLCNYRKAAHCSSTSCQTRRWGHARGRGDAQRRRAVGRDRARACPLRGGRRGGHARGHHRADPPRTHLGVAVTDSGIGMAPVQEIMGLQDGRIDVDSEPGIGTRVTLWFPLAEVARPAATAA